jgi:signal transduction histidine kinase/CheY-like chemotaxis protein/DNA-binding MarR family transcriptional regulator/PAS domain-containing protein
MNSKIDETKKVLGAFYRVIATYSYEWDEASFSLNETMVMSIIRRHKGIIASQISKQIALDPGQLSRLLTKLEKNGIVIRQEASKPPFEKTLSLSKKGTSISLAFEKKVDSAINKYLESLDEKERNHFLETMGTLAPIFDVILPGISQKEDVHEDLKTIDGKKASLADLGNLLLCVPGNFVFGFFENGAFFPKAFGDGLFDLKYLKKEQILEKGGEGFNELINPDDRELVAKAYETISSDSQKTAYCEFRIMGNDEAYHWVSFHFRQVFEENGVPLYGGSLSDVDEQKHSQSEALKIRQMYDDAAEAERMLIWTYDPSKHLIKMLDGGYTQEICVRYHIPFVIDDVPESLSSYIKKEDFPKLKALFAKVDAGADKEEGEIRLVASDNPKFEWEKMHFKRIYDEKGRFIEVHCWAQNISERKKAEERYEEARRSIENAYPNSIGFFKINLTRNTCGPIKHLPSSLKGAKWKNVDEFFLKISRLISDPEVKKVFFEKYNREKLLRDFEKGIDKVTLEYPTVRKDGLTHYGLGMLFLLRNPTTGDVEGITHAINMDEEKKNRLVLDGIIENAYDYVGLIEPSKGTFEFRSKRDWITYAPIGKPIPYEECCEYIRKQSIDPLELAGLKDAESIPAIVNALTNHGPFSLSYTQNRQGKLHCYQLHYNWLSEKGGPILLISSDITEAYLNDQKRIAELKEAKEQADAANKAKTDFLSRMSHDIRTPLNGIIGMTYLTEEKELSPEVRENIEKIDTSSKFLLSLINDILDMSKAESGHLDLHPQPYLLDDFERYVKAIAEPLCHSRYQEFAIEAKEADPEWIPLFDKLRLNQILFNLISNASKYTPENGRIVFRSSGTILPEHRMSIHMEVEDNGIGMSQEFLSHLFDPFHQASGSDRAEMRGTGLGLPIVKKLVDVMGGKISVVSTLGKGTLFKLDFPVEAKRRKDIVEPAASELTENDYSRLQGKHILLCEDNFINQEIARQILAEKGMFVAVAKDGCDGLRIFERSSRGYYSLILMDLRMPKMDGFEATKNIRALPRSDSKTIPIIAMTADAFSEDVQKCLDCGMNGHLAKPIEPQKLFADLLKFIP